MASITTDSGTGLMLMRSSLRSLNPSSINLPLQWANAIFSGADTFRQNNHRARYTLPCPEDPRETEIREAIKDVFSRPMIPGSSIKGAIRTTLLWDLIGDDNKEAQNDLKEQLQRRPNRNWAGQGIERRVLGKDPNHDLMRAVQVSDTAPISIDALEMGVAWTVTLNQHGELVQKREGNREYKTFVEQIHADQTFDFSIKIDKSLFGGREKSELGYSDHQERAVCEELADVCNFGTKELAKDEAEFYDYYRSPELANFYELLSNQIENLRMVHSSYRSGGERGISLKRSPGC